MRRSMGKCKKNNGKFAPQAPAAGVDFAPRTGYAGNLEPRKLLQAVNATRQFAFFYAYPSEIGMPARAIAYPSMAGRPREYNTRKGNTWGHSCSGFEPPGRPAWASFLTSKNVQEAIMANRKSLSSKVRFEVFKRDNFTCQYCGAKPPDVCLHADHFIPVAMGGPDDSWNLITACESCNFGKRDQLVKGITVNLWCFEIIGMRMIGGSLVAQMEAEEIKRTIHNSSFEDFFKKKGKNAIQDALGATHGKILTCGKTYRFLHSLTGDGVFGFSGRRLDFETDRDFGEVLEELGMAIFESIPPFGPDEGEYHSAKDIGESFLVHLSPGPTYCLCWEGSQHEQ